MGNMKSRKASQQAEEEEEEVPVERVEALTPIKAATTPHNFQAIIKEAAPQPSMAAPEEHMHSGIFLNNKTKKYWVDKETGMNCFALFARGLSITWSEDPRYWSWMSIKETGDVEVEAAELRNVCWLEIHGKLDDTSFLTPKAKYEVAFNVLLKEDLDLGGPVNLRLQFLPAGGVLEEREETLQEKPRGRWISLKVCELMTQQEQVGEIEVSLFSYTAVWKRGLVIKSVTFRPNK